MGVQAQHGRSSDCSHYNFNFTGFMGGGGVAIFAVKLDMSARSVCVCNCHKSCKLAEGNLWSDRENTGNFAASVRSVCVCNCHKSCKLAQGKHREFENAI